MKQWTFSENYRGGYGDYCYILGCQSVFYNANRIKTSITLFKQGVQEPQAFAFSAASVSDEHTKSRIKRKLRAVRG